MITFLSRLEVRSKLMGQMMERCGVNPAYLARERCGITMMQAAHACMACGRARTCSAWLQATEDGVLQDPPSFCPNARRFRQMQEAH